MTATSTGIVAHGRARRAAASITRKARTSWIGRFLRYVRTLWLSLVCRNRAIRVIVVPLVIAGLARATIALLGWRVRGWIAEVVLAVVLIGVTELVVELTRLWSLSPMLRQVSQIGAVTQEQNRQFLRKLAFDRITDTLHVVDGLAKGVYKPQNAESIRDWFDTFFEDGGATYKGVDSHVPSDYMARYRWYLTVHQTKLEVDGSASGARILISSVNDLTDDYLKDPDAWLEFVRWHKKNGVNVQWVESTAAARLRAEFNLINADVGLWDNYAVMFLADDLGQPQLSMRFPSEAPRDGVSYDNIQEFVARMEAIAHDLEEGPPGLDLIDEELAEQWEDYVDPDARLDPQGPLAKFLHSTLDGRRHVLDAAAGIGCESVHLLRRSYSVWTNEVDARLAEVGRKFAEHRKVRPYFTNYLWETLPQSLPGQMTFDAVLVLGNSLCMVKDARRRAKCVEAFAKILLPGGVLVIDERNFQDMLDRRRDIELDPISHFRPLIQGDVMYRGMDLRGLPTAITPEEVRWQFVRNTPPIQRTDEIPGRLLTSATLSLHPFVYGELFALLKKHFARVDVFADLVKVEECDGRTMPSRESVGRPDFITYVAYKK